jgi:hypothetical protein
VCGKRATIYCGALNATGSESLPAFELRIWVKFITIDYVSKAIEQLQN